MAVQMYAFNTYHVHHNGFSSPSRPSRPRSHQDSVTRWPTAVATQSQSISQGSGGPLMSLQVEGGTQVQVPRALMQAFLQQDPNHPGLETVRLPGGDAGAAMPSHCREVEAELCLVCRRCGRAYPSESSLLAHQRSCYLGHQQRRGALRLVQQRFACTLCGDKTSASSSLPSASTYQTLADWRRHAESPQHRGHLETGVRFSPGIQIQGVNPLPGEEVNPLTDEMEDVVNQITLLAARAAAESTTTTGSGQGGNQDNNNGPEAKRQKLMQEVAALAGAR